MAAIKTPPPSVAVPPVPPITTQPPVSGSLKTTPLADSVLVKSAAQHLFLQPRTFRMKHFLILTVLGLAAVLVAGAGYLKYQALRRLKIETAVTENLNTASSATLRKAALRVFVSDTRDVVLDGNVPSPEDFTLAESLAASVPGVTHVTNRVRVIGPALPPAVPATVPAESAASLISKGTAFLDAGEYPAAIECFRKAAADPTNRAAQELLERAQRAQKTEEELLRKRR
jgi:hypothetical protein